MQKDYAISSVWRIAVVHVHMAVVFNSEVGHFYRLAAYVANSHAGM